MKFYLEKSKKKKAPHPLVIRGKDAGGKPYRLFVKIDGQVIRVNPDQWNHRDQTIKGDPEKKSFLKDLKTALMAKVLQNKVINPSYSIPDAWNELFGTQKEEEKLSERVTEAIDPYMNDNKGNKTPGYLRHFTQLKNEIKAWNKDVYFSNLNEITLNSYLQYLKGEGSPARKPLKSSTIGHHFKHLRQVTKYASQRGVKVDPLVFDFNPGKVVYTEGCFDLTFEELMILWHYTPANKEEEIVLDYCLMEGFTGIRNGDLFSLKDGQNYHGLKCGDISNDYIGYRDRKNNNTLKTVTRHKFNERFIEKYLTADSNAFLLPPISQQTINSVIKLIANKCDLTRGIRRGSDIRPLHEVVTSHCFRSSYANLLYRLGITGEMVAEELGHAAPNVTIKHYLKFSNRHSIIKGKMNELEISRPESLLRKAI